VADQRAAIGRLAASNYANGDPALMGLSVMLTSQDPAEVTTQMNTVTALMSRQTTLLESLRKARAQMVVVEAQVEKARATVAVQRRAAAENLVRKESLEHSAAQARATVATLVARAKSATLAAARVRRADERQLRAAKKQEQRIRQLIIERSRRQHGGYSGGTGGFLFRPVPGWVTSPYGWRMHPIYHYWGLHDGTDFHAPCGTPERAGQSGTVISEVWSDVYGHRLYLDVGRVNGKNMTLVYNHLSAYRTHVGQRVRRGQTVGLAGTTGWSTGCHLHFTVLLDGSPVNPMNYM
jgi:murein DD-endopeptidase MepM/ murein hydrolase activator NlpD